MSDEILKLWEKRGLPIVIYNQRKNIYYGSKGIMKQTNATHNIYRYDKLSLINKNITNVKEAYEWLIKDINELIDISDGKYNLYNYNSITHMIRYLCIQKNNFVVEPIDTSEMELIDGATHGQWQANKKFEPQTIYAYDINSAYPYFLSSKQFYIPISPPIKLCINSTLFNHNLEERKLKGGIYHCKLTNTSNSPLYLAIKNDSNLYVHQDLYILYEENIEIELIDDYFWHYERRIAGYHIFSKYILELYEFKKKCPDNKLIKNLLSACWGVMSTKHKNLTYKTIDSKNPNEHTSYKEGESLLEYRFIDDRYCTLVIQNKNINENYPYGYARLKPFLLAAQRQRMYNIYKTNKESFLYVHTDCFWFNKPIGELEKKIYDYIGCWKYDVKHQTIQSKKKELNWIN